MLELTYLFLFLFFFWGCVWIGGLAQDGYAVVASDGPGEYPVIAESRAGDDGLGITVTPGTVAYVSTGGLPFFPLNMKKLQI